MRRFVGMQRYSRSTARMVVGVYLATIFASVGFGHYLLSLPTSWMTIVLVVFTAIFIGTRHRGLNNIIHECSHASFADERQDNTVIGSLCASLLLKSFTKYRDDHLSHHAHIGDYEMDHEFAPIKKFRLHEPLTARTVLRHIVTPLLGRHLRMYTGINLSDEDGRAYYWLKIAVVAAIVLFTILQPLTSLIFVIIPLFYIYPTINFWTDCLDHAGLVGAEDELEASRNVLAPTPVRLLFFPRNDCYHLVHHLFPQIPARHLHKAHAELCESPDYCGQPAAVWPTHRFLTPPLVSKTAAPASD
ncbi:fatty acid desaturase family protein [Frigidibacter sp. ROC022]|uniref:fatty acid desaturase family protein n=1 Tax=Frigidibacter sp. ROC022 TaxID=2971796 RepID=UPI00215B107B|nr:fatty acid desaturase [Frigidibacter sp. ROC022]MCR8724693.1 fatty acid desaturase [Frigidibacter sp. ROC022]